MKLLGTYWVVVVAEELDSRVMVYLRGGPRFYTGRIDEAQVYARREDALAQAAHLRNVLYGCSAAKGLIVDVVKIGDTSCESKFTGGAA